MISSEHPLQQDPTENSISCQTSSLLTSTGSARIGLTGPIYRLNSRNSMDMISVFRLTGQPMRTLLNSSVFMFRKLMVFGSMVTWIMVKEHLT